MKYFYIKLIKVALIVFNATFSFSQNSSNIDSLLNIVELRIEKEDYRLAIVLIDSIKTMSEYSLVSKKLKVDFILARLYKTRNEHEKALKILLNGLTIINGDASSKFTADYAYEIGNGFSRIKDYPIAFKYFRLVLLNSQKRNDSLGISKGYLGLGSIHLLLYKGMKRALIESDSVSLKTHGDSSIYYYDKSILISPNGKLGQKYLADVYSNLVVYNFYEKNFEIAEKYCFKSLNIHQINKDTIKMARVFNLLGAVHVRKGNYVKSKNYYTRGFNLVKKRKLIRSIELKERFLNNLSDVNYNMDNYKLAYDYRVLSSNLKDSLRGVSDNLKYAEYEAKYNLSEKERLAEIEKNKRKKAEVWIYVFAISSIILLSFLWLLFRSNKHKRENQELEFLKEKLLREREIEVVKNETQIKILNATIDGKETERRHIAEILHDNVSALLSSAGLHLQAAKIQLKGKAPEEISKSQAIVHEAGDKIRNLSHKLISAVLLKFGLSYAVEDLCEKYSNSHLTFEFKTEEIHRFDQDFEIKIHNIIEELMNNIMKHSDAKKAHVLLKQQDGKLQVHIFDDGIGFDVDKIRMQNSGGLGLTQIDARIKMMEGDLKMVSSKKEGTQIFIHVPIPTDD